MIVFVFVLFNSCCMNLNYMSETLFLKKSFFHSFKTCKKNKFDFSIVKNPFFLLT